MRTAEKVLNTIVLVNDEVLFFIVGFLQFSLLHYKTTEFMCGKTKFLTTLMRPLITEIVYMEPCQM